jgi:hypothetical protein
MTFGSPNGIGVKFGGAEIANCVSYDYQTEIDYAGLHGRYCRIAYIMGTGAYSSNLPTVGNWCLDQGGLWKPALIQVDETTGIYADTDWHTRITTRSPFYVGPTPTFFSDAAPNPRTQGATCVKASDGSTIRDYILQTGMFTLLCCGGLSLVPLVNYSLPPAKVQSINF